MSRQQQLWFRGMNVEKVKKGRQKTVKEPKPEVSQQFEQLPMFMSAREIMKTYRPLEGDREVVWPGERGKRSLYWHPQKVETSADLYERKRQESLDRSGSAGTMSLYDDIADNGPENPVSLQLKGAVEPGTMESGPSMDRRPQVLGGHHRLAVMAAERPDDLMPVEHFRDLWQARGWLQDRY